MSSRTINNPGIELNEIDRSSYDKIDNSLPNSPTLFVTGFADKGQDMTLEWINSKSTLDDTFGTPTTEFESYMYNAAIEILNRGGSCIASRLPYANEQFQKYNYIEFDASEIVYVKNSFHPLTANTEYETIYDIHDALSDVLQQLSGMERTDIGTISKMADAIIYINETYLPEHQTQQIIIDTISDLSSQLVNFISSYVSGTDTFSLLYFNDFNLTSYIDIKVKPIPYHENEYGAKGKIEDLDDYITSQRLVDPGTIRIYDMTRAQYQQLDNYACISCPETSSSTGECLGIVPVIVTPANAMYFQNILSYNASMEIQPDYTVYNGLSTYATMHHSKLVQMFGDVSEYISLPLASNSDFFNVSLTDVDSLSRRAARQFPAINFYNADHFDKTNLKKIGVVVFKAFQDAGNNGKINFQLLESFVGSLGKNDRDPITKASTFIDDIVNQNSQFIKMFSNVNQSLIQKAETYATSKQPAIAMGFYKIDCAKKISFMDSIMKPLATILEKAANPNRVPVDIVVDGGVSNIAQLAKNAENGIIDTDNKPRIGNYEWPFNYMQHDTTAWSAVLSKFDNFCKCTRKDCMFIADGIRPMCLQGDSKIVRSTALWNNVANQIIPKFKYIAHALDSSYSAGYCNWFYQIDYSNMSDMIWMPPSIKVAGVYIYCDTYFHPWSAPAGNVRGIVKDAVDVAFIPSDVDAGVIYSNSWNYAMSYPLNGIVIEGHKTFQSQRTALDRVNVRRLMLSLEKKVAAIARHFVYEQNSPYMRQQFVDNISPILENAVAGSGISEYAIKCDDELNTPQVIDNNEMRCKIAVKPVKVVDWIVIDFICTNQSISVNEEVMR